MAASLDSIEALLTEIKDNTGGFQEITTSDELDKKLRTVTEKIEEIFSPNSNRNIGVQNTAQQSGNDSKNLGTTIGEILGHVAKIHEKVNAIDSHYTGSGSINRISKKVEKAIEYLETISKHVGNKPSNIDISNGNNTEGGSVERIDKNVEGIYKEITQIRTSLAEKTLDTGNEELNKKLQELLSKQTDRKLEEEKFRELEKKASKGDSSAQTEYVKELKARKQQEKEKKRLQNKAEHGRFANAANAGTKATEFIGGFLKGKASASAAADKAIGTVSKMGPYGALIGTIMSAIKALLELGSKIDRASSTFSRTFGGGIYGKQNVAETVREGIRKSRAGRGYTSDAMFSALTEVAEARGRNTERMSAKDLQSAVDLKRFGIGAEAINGFDTFGKSIEQTDKYFAKLYSEVSKKGLSFKNVSKAVNDNLKAAQSHTFANGLRGLEAMAERSVQLKYNMQQVFQFADKVSEVEGAIGTAANLSVLGGSFAQFSNPMQLLYEGLNDMESLQKRIEGMFGNKTFWNQEKGQMDMTALDREMVKQAAKAAGLDANEMLNMSYNQGRMNLVEKQLGRGLSKDTTEYVKNIAEIDKNGQAYVTLNGQTKAVSDITDNDKAMLEKESKLKEQSDNAKLGDIYSETMSIGERIDNILQYLKERLGVWVYGLFKRLGGGEAKRQEAAQGNTNDEALRSLRLQYYKDHVGEQSNKTQFANDVGRMSREMIELRTSQASKGANGIMPKNFRKLSNGSEPIFSTIGEQGIISKPRKNKSYVDEEGIVRGKKHLQGGELKEIEDGEAVTSANATSYLESKRPGIWHEIQQGLYDPNNPKPQNSKQQYSTTIIKNDMSRIFNPLSVADTNQSKNVANSKMNNVNGQIKFDAIKFDTSHPLNINLNGYGNIGNIDLNQLAPLLVPYIQKWFSQMAFAGNNKEDMIYKTNVV